MSRKIYKRAFAALLEQVASGDQDEPIIDPEGPGGIIFLTEYNRLVDGKYKLWCGPRIEARDLQRAEEIGNALGLRVLGEFTGEESADEKVIDRVKQAKDQHDRRN